MSASRSDEPVQTQHDLTAVPATEAIVGAICKADPEPTRDARPLYRFIDTEALDKLVDRCNAKGTDFHLSFTIEGTHIAVRGDGTITVDTEVERTPTAPDSRRANEETRRPDERVPEAAEHGAVERT